MKRLMLSAAVAAMFLTGGAINAHPINQSAKEGEFLTVIQQEQEYVEIELEDVPDEINDAVAKNYEGAEVQKAYVNDEGVYKLDIEVEEEEQTVYFNEDGTEAEEE